MLIFEDDVLIAEALADILRNRHKFPKDWEFNYFSTNAPPAPFGGFFYGYLPCLPSWELADRAGAYLLNPTGARKSLAHVFPIGHTADGLTWRTDITGLVSYVAHLRAGVLSDLDSSIWTKGEIPKKRFRGRKGAEFAAIVKSISRFFGITQL